MLTCQQYPNFIVLKQLMLFALEMKKERNEGKIISMWLEHKEIISNSTVILHDALNSDKFVRLRLSNFNFYLNIFWI